MRALRDLFCRGALGAGALVLFVLACNPSEKEKDSRAKRDLLADDKAMPSVPVAGTNLTFTVDASVQDETLDAYIVGYPDTLKAERLAPRRYLIQNVPVGTRDIIVTAKSQGARLQAQQTFDRGLRLRKELLQGEVLDLGELKLPPTGSVKGRLEMDGISSFQTVQVTIPGTKLVATKPAADGAYNFENLPVGLHDFGALQELNPKLALGAGEVASQSLQQNRRIVVRSVPNIPNSLQIVPKNNSLQLSWNTGGGDIEGYLLFKRRANAEGSFKPEAGKTYQLGALSSGDIVAVGAANSFADVAVRNGTSYTYEVYAYNKDKVYSQALIGTGTPRVPAYQYSSYRLVIDSTASDCDGFGTTQIQSLRFHMDSSWQVNDFSAANNIGKIGRHPVIVSSNSVYNNAYEPYNAFVPDNNAWSSLDDAFSITEPYDVNRTAYPNGVYLLMQFSQGPVEITGLEILGGEPPLLPQCAPDRYHLDGSNDGGSTWTLIPGSNRAQPTIQKVRYYFAPVQKPLSPTDVRILASNGQVKFTWETGAGSENNYMLVRSRQPVPFAPEAGRPYNVGKVGDYEIVYLGSEQSFVDNQGLDNDGTVYYYSLFALDAQFSYATPVIGRAVPEARSTYRYYRFVVDSIVGGEGTANYVAWMEDLKLQIEGRWITRYSFTGERGTIDGIPVLVKDSGAFNASDRGWRLFADGRWLTADKTFLSARNSDAANNRAVWVQMDFEQPVAITGMRFFGNSGLDPVTREFSSEAFAQVPDLVHMEYSSDGIQWKIVPMSEDNNLAAEPIDREW